MRCLGTINAARVCNKKGTAVRFRRNVQNFSFAKSSMAAYILFIHTIKSMHNSSHPYINRKSIRKSQAEKGCALATLGPTPGIPEEPPVPLQTSHSFAVLSQPQVLRLSPKLSVPFWLMVRPPVTESALRQFIRCHACKHFRLRHRIIILSFICADFRAAAVRQSLNAALNPRYIVILRYDE